MRFRKRACALISMAIALIFAAGLLAFPQNVRAEDYQYTIRVYAGSQGTVNGQQWVSFTVDAYSYFDLGRVYAVAFDDNKYYVRGFRISGEDALFNRQIFLVDQDYDFAVAYGMPHNQVEYTVNYIEYETGRVLLDPITYYGNLGDKPVVAYQYIENYTPLYRNITGTLGPSGTNNWTFQYVPETQPVPEQPTQPAQQGGDTTVQPGQPAQQGGDTTVQPGANPGGNTGTQPGQNTGNQPGQQGGNTTVQPGTNTGTGTNVNNNPGGNTGTNVGGNTGTNVGTNTGGGNTGGNTGTNVGTNTGGGNTGANVGGNTGANVGTNTGGNTGTNVGTNTGAGTNTNTGGNTRPGGTGNNANTNVGGNTGANVGTNTGGGNTGANVGGNTGNNGGTNTNIGGNIGGNTGFGGNNFPITEDILDMDVPLAVPQNQTEGDDQTTSASETTDADAAVEATDESTAGTETQPESTNQTPSHAGSSVNLPLILAIAAAVIILIVILIVVAIKKRHKNDRE